MELHVCKNCNTPFPGSFCNHCGQKLAHRITLTHIGHDLAHAFTHADKGIIHLFWQLFVRPGTVAREYIVEGKRKKYFNPFQYLLIIASIGAFVVINSHYIDHVIASTTQPGMSKNQLEFSTRFVGFMGRYFNMIIILQLPFFSMASYLMYKKYAFNFAEHLTLHTLMTAQTTIITTGMMLITAISSNLQLYMVSSSIISVAYSVYTYLGFFEEYSIKGVLKALVCYVLGILFYILAITLVVAVSVFIFVYLKKMQAA